MRFWMPSDSPHNSERQADYLGALLCGVEPMERMLVRLIETFNKDGAATSTHPSLAQRLSVIRSSVEDAAPFINAPIIAARQSSSVVKFGKKLARSVFTVPLGMIFVRYQQDRLDFKVSAGLWQCGGRRRRCIDCLEYDSSP
jgi:hypothetical protein